MASERARRVLTQGADVLLMTDGLERDDTVQLSKEMQRLRRNAKRIVWLNPLLRFEGYAPLAQGAAELHRAADAMLAVHNLSSLEQLATSLAGVMRR